MSILLQIPSAPTDQQKKHIETINCQIEKLSCHKPDSVIDSRVEVTFRRMKDLVDKRTDLSLEEICIINKLVSGDGELRGPIENFLSKNNIAIRGYHGAPGEDLEQLLREYAIEYNPICKFSEPLLKICGAYLVFVLLHPFRDGNGRTGRIITAWLMCSQGYAALAPYLEKAMGNENVSHGKMFESGINNYLAWTGIGYLSFNAYFMNFFDGFLTELILISQQILKENSVVVKLL
jgi:hypothetical protein